VFFFFFLYLNFFRGNILIHPYLFKWSKSRSPLEWILFMGLWDSGLCHNTLPNRDKSEQGQVQLTCLYSQAIIANAFASRNLFSGGLRECPVLERSFLVHLFVCPFYCLLLLAFHQIIVCCPHQRRSLLLVFNRFRCQCLCFVPSLSNAFLESETRWVKRLIKTGKFMSQPSLEGVVSVQSGN